ncbi:MAG: hypothetical protein ACFFCO_11575 [Promethearchaeota archaeon]
MAEAIRRANLVYISASESSLLFQFSEVPEKATIEQVSRMLVELVGQPFRVYAGPENLLLLLEGFPNKHVKHHFSILVQVLETANAESPA